MLPRMIEILEFAFDFAAKRSAKKKSDVVLISSELNLFLLR